MGLTLEQLGSVLRVFLEFEKHVGNGDCYLSRSEVLWQIEWITRGSRWCHQWQFAGCSPGDEESLAIGAADIARREFAAAIQERSGQEEKRDNDD